MTDWIDFTGISSSVGWTNPANAIDGNTGTYAEYDKTGTWTTFLAVSCAPHVASSIRFYVTYEWGGNIGHDWDLLLGGSWVDFRSGGTTGGGYWSYDPLPAPYNGQTITGMRLRLASGVSFGWARIHVAQHAGAIIEEAGQPITYFFLA